MVTGTSLEVAQRECVTISLCGPVSVRCGGAPVPVGGPREQAVLAALALRGRASIPHLVDWLWGDDPPVTARKCVQNAVMLLRRSLAPVGLAIDRDGDGYRLELVAGPVAAPGAPVDLTGPGEPLAGLPATPAVEAARDHLRSERLTGVERQLRARLAVDPDAVTAEAERLLTEDPYREQLWSLLVDAHHRAGRPGAALASFRRARNMIVAELGIEPGPVLQEAHRRVLAFDPAARAARVRRARDHLARGVEAAAVGDAAQARQVLLDAAAAARAAGDTQTLASAAVALAGHGPWLLGDATVESLLEEALAVTEATAAVPVLAALARLRALRGDQRARRHAEQALALAAEAPPAHRTAALVAQLTVAQGPDDTVAREQLARLLLDHSGLDPVAGPRTARPGLRRSRAGTSHPPGRGSRRTRPRPRPRRQRSPSRGPGAGGRRRACRHARHPPLGHLDLQRHRAGEGRRCVRLR